MKAWLISVVGVVVLIAVAEMILPQGRLRSAIRSVFSIVLMLVVLAPLPSIKNAEWNGKYEIPMDEGTVEGVYTAKVVALENDCEAMLKSKGYENVEIVLLCEGGERVPSVRQVIVSGVAQSEDVTKVLCEYLGVSVEKVVFA